MLRLAYPLVLLAALAAGRAHAQEGDRYGPRPAPSGAAASAAQRPVVVRAAFTPELRSGAPALRTLSWPGKAELRPALAPALAAPAPAEANAALRTAPVPTGRFPSMAAYAAPAPSLRQLPAYAEGAPTARARPAPLRTARGRSAAGTTAAHATAPVQETLPVSAPASPGRTPTQSGWSNLPAGLATPPAYVPPGPNYGPALAAAARDQAKAAGASTTDTLPPPTVGRYGYVGPGRGGDAAPQAQPLPRPTTPVPGDSAAANRLGPPRPPAYARGYVMPAQAANPASTGAPAASPSAPAPSGATAMRSDGSRRYSVHREYGMEPDPMPVPPQFFAATPDLSAPATDTAPVLTRNTKASVNAARLAAAGG